MHEAPADGRAEQPHAPKALSFEEEGSHRRWAMSVVGSARRGAAGENESECLHGVW